jgi:hypothetical protein
MKMKAILMTAALCFVLLFLDRLGVFKNALAGAVIVILLVLAIPIHWQIKEYIKKKYPDMIPAEKCPVCGFEIPEGSNHCLNCGKVMEHEITTDEKFAEDAKEKKICPSCGLKELETIYEVSRGYKEVCASCGKSRVSGRALKFTLLGLSYLIAIVLLFYWLLITSMK